VALVSRSAVATALNLTERRVAQLVHEGLPRASRGLYDLGACMAWYIRYLQAVVERRSDGSDRRGENELRVEKIRIARAEAGLREAELQRVSREVMLVSEARAAAFVAARRARDQVLVMPDRLAPILAGMTDQAECHRLMHAECFRICEELGAASIVQTSASTSPSE
jgi:phage terminase Nu1 subunit (DNA packaging protein)